MACAYNTVHLRATFFRETQGSMAKRNGFTAILTKRNLYESVRQNSIFNEKAWGRILEFGPWSANRESTYIYIYIFFWEAAELRVPGAGRALLGAPAP